MKCQSLFSGKKKKRKIFQKCLLKILPSMLSIKIEIYCIYLKYSHTFNILQCFRAEQASLTEYHIYS